MPVKATRRRATDHVQGETVITGGAGFIGSHLARHLIKLGRRVLVIDDLSTGRLENIQPLLGDACRFIHAPVGRALNENSSLLDGVDCIYHLAAGVGVQLVVDEPAQCIHNNVHETAIVLRAAAETGVPVLIASSSEVYGKSDSVPMREDDKLVYGPTTSPRWSYGLSKAIDEHLALAHAAGDGLPVVIVRLFNTIGLRQIGRYGMVVPRFVRAAIEGRDLEVHGDGKQTRAFCDVRDVVRGMTELMATPAARGQVLNLGSDREISILDLAHLIIELSQSKSGVNLIPYDRAYRAGFEDTPRRVPDLTRIRQVIGFEPRFALEQTLSHLIIAAREEQAQQHTTVTQR
jgi:UDP-glucose 4-epimerase